MHDILSLTLYHRQFLVFDHLLVATLTGYGALILLTCLYVYWQYIGDIFVRKVPPPISVWGLWLLLDVVATSAELARGVFNVQLVGYTIGTAVIVLVLWRRRVLAWDPLWDGLSAIAVFMAIGLLLLTDDPLFGLLFSLSGMTIASVPLVRAIVAGADESPVIWGVILLGSVLSACDGNLVSGVWLGVVQVFIITLIFRFQKKEMCAT